MSTYKRYVLSSIVTFLTAFFITVGPVLDAGQPITNAGLIAILSVGGRAGLKALIEWFVGQNADLPSQE